MVNGLLSARAVKATLALAVAALLVAATAAAGLKCETGTIVDTECDDGVSLPTKARATAAPAETASAEPEEEPASSPKESSKKDSSSKSEDTGAGPGQTVAVAAERVGELAAPLAVPMGLALIAFLLLGAAARGPGRLTKLEEYGDGGVYRL